MHELGLCKSILDIIDSSSVGHQFSCIKKIHLEIGALLAVDKRAMIFCFEVIAKNTKAKDALLEIININGEALCEDCKQIVKVQQYSDSCSNCGSFYLTIIQGEELRVKSMEVV